MRSKDMKKYFALIFAFVTCSTLANSNLYPYCNVFIGTACFGVKDGDEYKSISQIDFRTYEVNLSSGDKIDIYSGYHPEIFNFKDAYLVKESINEYLVSARKIDKTRHRILIESTKNRVPFVDINISIAGDDKRILNDFLQNFKSCTRTKLATSCMENSLLKNIVL